MDEPITYSHPRYKLDPPKQPDLWQSLLFALTNDLKDEFMRVIKDPGFGKYNAGYVPDLIFQCDAVEIATGVFNGETEGIIDMEDLFKHGSSALHLAAFHGAPRLTKYLLHRGDNLDVTYDGEFWEQNVKNFTPFDFIIETIRYFGARKSLFEMLTWLCYHHRGGMEVLRLLVLNMQNTTQVRQKCIQYAHEGGVHKLAALFIAVPELFLSSPGSGLSLLSELELELNPLVNNTDIEKQQLSLLLDIFFMVGHEIAAYIRLPEFCVVPDSIEAYYQSYLEVDFFLRKVSLKKLGVCCPDYYLRFFDAGPINYADPDPDDDPSDVPDWDYYASHSGKISVLGFLPMLLDSNDFNRTDIYRLIPKLDPQSAARLNSAIQKKVSSMSGLHGSLKTVAKISEEVGKLLQGLPIFSPKSFEFTVPSLRTSMASGKQKFDVKLTPITSEENKVIQHIKYNNMMQLTKLNSILPLMKPSNWVQVAKRLVK